MTPDQLVETLRAEDVPHERIADAIGLTRPVAWKLVNGKRQLKVKEIEPLTKLLHQWRFEQKIARDTRAAHERMADALGAGSLGSVVSRAARERDDLPGSIFDGVRKAAEAASQSDRPDDNSYVGVPMLPMYGGMGGGGIGEVLKDQELEMRLVPRALVEDILRGRPSDFIWIRVRGDSMEPDFQHDDELICDLRDTSPMQPGPFALFHEDGYYVKNVERTTDGRVRIFSSNPKYTAVEEPTEMTRIIGRPVWFGRRL